MLVQTNWTDERVQDVARMLGERMSASQIAAVMQVSRNAVIGIARRRNLQFARREGQAVLPGTPRNRAYKPRARVKMAAPTAAMTAESTLRVVDVEPRHIALIDLEKDECHYPFGEGPFTFCGLPADDGCYCSSHFALTRNFGPRGYERRRRYSRWGTLIKLEVVA